MAVTYTAYDTSSKEETGGIFMFAHFDESTLLSETRDDAESSDKFNNNSIMPPLISEDEMNSMDSGNESEDEHVSKDMLEEIIDGSQSHPRINVREAHCKYVIALSK